MTYRKRPGAFVTALSTFAKLGGDFLPYVRIQFCFVKGVSMFFAFPTKDGRKWPPAPKTGRPRAGAGISGPRWCLGRARPPVPGQGARVPVTSQAPSGFTGAGNSRPSFRTLIADKGCSI